MGGIYTSNGDEVRPPDVPTSHPVEAPPLAEEGTPTANPTSSMATVVTSNAAESVATPESQPVTSGGASEQEEGNFPSTLEDSLTSTVFMQMAESSPTIGNYDEFVRREQGISRSKVALGVIIAVVGALGAAALSARSGRGRTLLTFLALVGGGQCANTHTTTFIHSSDFSIEPVFCL